MKKNDISHKYKIILKLAIKSNGFLKLAQWVVSLNINLDIGKTKAKP